LTALQRLAVALTALLTLTAGVVVAGYVFIFSASQDRAAHAAPADTAAYATIYLQPSTGQRLNLADLLGHVPGFADAANLEQKIHDIAQRLLGATGLDYEADIRPWLGNQLSVAISVDQTSLAPDRVLLLVGVKDATEANAALARILAQREVTPTVTDDHGVAVVEGGGMAYALLDDLLVVAPDAAAVRAALDADAQRSPSLADSADFRGAARRIPADHLAAVYLNLARLGPTAQQTQGYGTVELALVVEPDGLRLAGNAPFDSTVASEEARQQFALSSEPSALSSWMPADTRAEIVLFGVAQTLGAAEAALGATPGLEGAADALTQLRALAALGLGISLDNDVLPVLDRDVAVAVQDVGGALPSGQLLARPSDRDAAAAALARIGDALAERGASVIIHDSAGTPVTTVRVPDLGSLSWAMRDGVVVVGLEPADVNAALDAHAVDETLAMSDGYRRAWGLTGVRAGNEAYVDVGWLVDAMGSALSLPDDGRDILHAISALAITAPARDNETEFHLVLTAR
jgi:Protein of unknown function (DUF3352)